MTEPNPLSALESLQGSIDAFEDKLRDRIAALEKANESLLSDNEALRKALGDALILFDDVAAQIEDSGPYGSICTFESAQQCRAILIANLQKAKP